MARSSKSKSRTTATVNGSILAQQNVTAPIQQSKIQQRSWALSQDASLFAVVNNLGSQGQLRVFSVVTGECIAEASLPSTTTGTLLSGRLVWGYRSASKQVDSSDMNIDSVNSQKDKKRRKKKIEQSAVEQNQSPILALPLSDGTVKLFDPASSLFLADLQVSFNGVRHPIASCCFTPSGEVWALASEISTISRLSLSAPTSSQKEVVLRDSSSLQYISSGPSAIAGALSSETQGLIVASQAPVFLGNDCQELFRLTGHTTPINSTWSSEKGFTVTSAHDDRCAIVSSHRIAQTVANLASSAPVVKVVGHENFVAVVNEKGQLDIFDLSETIRLLEAESISKVHTPRPLAHVEVALEGLPSDIVDVAFRDEKTLLLTRMTTHSRPIFEELILSDHELGSGRNQITLTRQPLSLIAAATADQKAPKRFTAPQEKVSKSADATAAEALDLHKDLAEVALEERIQPVTGPQSDGPTTNERPVSQAVPTHSLAAMLAQALHSGDVTLLESCFQLAIPLLAAVLDRLGKGSKASGQRGAMLILWVKETLSFHTAYLLSIPDLVQRLAGLHQLLARRLETHQQLQNLGGRLDLIVSQLDLKSAATQGSSKTSQEVYHYDEANDQMGMSDEGPEIERSQDDETGVQEITLEEDLELGSGDDEDSMLNSSSEDDASDESGSDEESIMSFDEDEMDSEEEAEIEELERIQNAKKGQKGSQTPSAKKVDPRSKMIDLEASEGSESDES